MTAIFPSKLRHVNIVCAAGQVQRLAFVAKPVVSSTPAAKKLTVLLARYFAGERVSFAAVPLAVQSTDFQQRVWQAMQTIPYGQVRTYAQLAAQIGQPRAVRAVGNAAAANPVVIVIPCHRVIRSDGSIGNYGGGRLRKHKLLALEGHKL